MEFFWILIVIYSIIGIFSKKQIDKSNESHQDQDVSSYRQQLRRNLNKQRMSVENNKIGPQTKIRDLLNDFIGEDAMEEDFSFDLDSVLDYAHDKIRGRNQQKNIDQEEQIMTYTKEENLDLPLEAVISEELSDMEEIMAVEQDPDWLEDDSESLDDQPLITTQYKRQAKRQNSPYMAYIKDKEIVKQLMVFNEILNKPKGFE